MPKEIEPSVYQCDCGYVARFSENTVRDAKDRSLTKKQWISEGAGLEKHIVFFENGEMTVMLWPCRCSTPPCTCVTLWTRTFAKVRSH